jgi:hypothetical protein
MGDRLEIIDQPDGADIELGGEPGRVDHPARIGELDDRAADGGGEGDGDALGRRAALIGEEGATL